MSPKNTNKPTLCPDLVRDRIVDISCGHDHSLFLRDDGLVYACGSPQKGQIGDQFYHPEKAEKPYVAIYLFTSRENKCVKVQAGDGFSVFLTKNGQVHTCGEGNYGRLGHETTRCIAKPSIIDFFRKKLIKIIDVAVGGRHTYAISEKKELYVWGFGYYYQLATENREDSFEPIKISFSKEVEQVS